MSRDTCLYEKIYNRYKKSIEWLESYTNTIRNSRNIPNNGSVKYLEYLEHLYDELKIKFDKIESIHNNIRIFNEDIKNHNNEINYDGILTDMDILETIIKSYKYNSDDYNVFNHLKKFNESYEDIMQFITLFTNTYKYSKIICEKMDKLTEDKKSSWKSLKKIITVDLTSNHNLLYTAKYMYIILDYMLKLFGQNFASMQQTCINKQNEPEFIFIRKLLSRRFNLQHIDGGSKKPRRKSKVKRTPSRKHKNKS